MFGSALQDLRCGRLAAVVSLAILAALAGGAAPLRAEAAATLTLYSGQHEQSVNLLTADFQKRTGIAVKVKAGEAPEIANQIAEEGASSPADVYFTENSPELQLLDEKGLLAPVEAKTLARGSGAIQFAADGDWVGVLARENVLAFNTAMIQARPIAAFAPGSRQAGLERQDRHRAERCATSCRWSARSRR